jgi:hypothetical protein
MKYEDILNILAPCGLNCVKCVGYENGAVRKHAGELHAHLEGFGRFAERFSRFVPAFKKYSSFDEVLDVFVGANCAGCRDNEANIRIAVSRDVTKTEISTSVFSVRTIHARRME